MKNLPCSWIDSISIVKMAILPQPIYSQCNPHQSSNKAFTDLEITELIFIRKNLKKYNLGEIKQFCKIKKPSRDITIPNFMLYCRIIATKSLWYWYDNRHTDQWNHWKAKHKSTQLWTPDFNNDYIIKQ